MGVLDGAGRESPVLHLPVKVLYMSWRELSKLDAPDGRDYVAPYLSLVGRVRAGPDASPGAIIEPPFHVLSDAHVLIVEDEPTVTVSYGLGELLSHVLTTLAVDVASLGSLGSLHPVLADPVSILAAVDRALVVAASFSHPCPLLHESAPKGQLLGLRPASLSFEDAPPAFRPRYARWCCRRH